MADENNDPQLADFVESEFLVEQVTWNFPLHVILIAWFEILPQHLMSNTCNIQVEAIKKISEFVAQLRRVGAGHGIFSLPLLICIVPIFFISTCYSCIQFIFICIFYPYFQVFGTSIRCYLPVPLLHEIDSFANGLPASCCIFHLAWPLQFLNIEKVLHRT